MFTVNVRPAFRSLLRTSIVVGSPVLAAVTKSSTAVGIVVVFAANTFDVFSGTTSDATRTSNNTYPVRDLDSNRNVTI